MFDEEYDSYPVGWRHGLISLSVAYFLLLATVGASLFLKSQVKTLDERMATLNRASDEAVRAEDHVAVRSNGAEFDALYHRARQLQVAALGLALISIISFLVFVWGTWQITRLPVSRWETYARYAAVLSVVLVPLVAIVGRSEETNTLRLLIVLLIATGHEFAQCKIARLTEQWELLKRLRGIYNGYRLVLLIVATTFAFGSLGLVPDPVVAPLIWMAAVALIVFVVTLGMTLWQLGRSLDAVALGGPAALVED